MGGCMELSDLLCLLLIFVFEVFEPCSDLGEKLFRGCPSSAERDIAPSCLDGFYPMQEQSVPIAIVTPQCIFFSPFIPFHKEECIGTAGVVFVVKSAMGQETRDFVYSVNNRTIKQLHIRICISLSTVKLC